MCVLYNKTICMSDFISMYVVFFCERKKGRQFLSIQIYKSRMLPLMQQGFQCNLSILKLNIQNAAKVHRNLVVRVPTSQDVSHSKTAYSTLPFLANLSFQQQISTLKDLEPLGQLLRRLRLAQDQRLQTLRQRCQAVQTLARRKGQVL